NNERATWGTDGKSALLSVRCLQGNSTISSSSFTVALSSSSIPSSSSSLQSGSVAYEGQTYRTVRIGSQTWFAENLNYAVAGSKCYDNDPANCVKYGRLYDWSTAMGFASSCNSNSCSSQIQSPHRGICPSGWHIPSNDDWDKLYRYADGTSGTSSPYDSPTAGKHLKAQSGWNPYSGIENLDTYGFSALPGGHGNSGGSFHLVGNYGGWWSASEYNSYLAYYRYMSYDFDDARWFDGSKNYLFSVRCVQD
ncbi:MAG: fibrobacter succinogenes major paralogous domain-containing protein, partial [Candidatus Fibromonas sp.]|nr:fibrobacter succinogenes major paralogous domain-containing protein [Candidatus Fibromonas sp.]